MKGIELPEGFWKEYRFVRSEPFGVLVVEKIEDEVAPQTWKEIRDKVEKEIMIIEKQFTDHPKRLSVYGAGYWQGNIDGLKWILTKIGELHSSAQKVKEEN